MSFEIEIGGTPEIKTEINPITYQESVKNFETCIHRSELTTYWVRSSCGCQPGSNVQGRICNKLQIQGINPVICAGCSSFEAKS